MYCETDKMGRTHRHCGNGRGGFTLIELLVVIAIIAILASILFPVFASAREKARASSCLSNLKQLGLAVEQYKQDCDGYYPFARNYSDGGTWYNDFLAPYIKNSQITICPDDSIYYQVGYSYNVAFGYYPGGEHTPTSMAGIITSYCGENIPTYNGVNESLVGTPDKAVLMLDASLMYAWLTDPTENFSPTNAGMAYNIDQWTPGYSASSMAVYNNAAAAIHQGGLNNLFADGHAKWETLNYMMNWTIYCPTQP